MNHDEHRTAAGLLSMDLTKWRVASVQYEDGGEVRTMHSFGIFPPNMQIPTLLYPTHMQAMNAASRYAFFNVVPPQQIQELINEQR